MRDKKDLGWDYGKMFLGKCLETREPLWLKLTQNSETFLIEYGGEIISGSQLRKRVKQYLKEGLEHYYFMTLKTNEVGLSSQICTFQKQTKNNTSSILMLQKRETYPVFSIIAVIQTVCCKNGL